MPTHDDIGSKGPKGGKHSRRPAMLHATVGTIVIAVHGPDTPPDSEWNAYIEEFERQRDLNAARNFVCTDGGAPSTTQRRAINERLLQNGRGLCGVVTGSAMVRGVVTALNWFNPFIKAFSPEQARQAYAHLNMTAEEIAMVRLLVERMRKELGLEPMLRD